MFGKRLWLALTLMLVVAGCSHNMERVTLPPEAPMEGIRRISVVGITNHSVDPGLGVLFEQLVTANLRESDYYQVVDSATARSALARIGAGIDELADPAVARRLGAELGVDALIWGTATYYFDDVHLSTPNCSNCGVENRQPFWSVRQTTSVLTTLQARVVRTNTGAIIWSKVADGRDTTQRTINISWSQNEPPPPALIPQSSRSDLPETRQMAARNAAREFTKDLLPRQIWVRTD